MLEILVVRKTEAQFQTIRRLEDAFQHLCPIFAPSHDPQEHCQIL